MKYLVAGNYTRFAVTLTQKSGELIMPYVPTEGDVVQISLYGARRFDYPNYTQSSNVLTFEDNGCLNVGLYCLEVKLTEANTHKLRCMYREQIRVVASNDDVPTDATFTDDDVQLSGQFDIAASVEITIDDELSLTSTNPVQNKVVTAALNTKYDSFYYDIFPDAIDLYFLADGEYLSNWYIESATTSAAGLMSAADKTKLDGIETGANKTIYDNAPTQSSTNAVTSGGVYSALVGKQDTLTFDNAPTQNSDNPVKSGGVYTALRAKLNKIDDGVYVSTQSGGRIDFYASGTQYILVQAPIPNATTTDNGLMSASDYAKLAALPTNADLTTALNGKQATLTWDTVPTQGSNNPVTSGGLYSTLLSKEDKVAIEAPVNSVDAEQPITTLTTETSKYYRIDVAVETLAITLPAMTDSTKIANVVLYLTGGTTPAVTIASTAPSGGTAPDVYYQDGFAIEAGKTYEVNCLWNGVAWVVAAVEIVIS